MEKAIKSAKWLSKTRLKSDLLLKSVLLIMCKLFIIFLLTLFSTLPSTCLILSNNPRDPLQKALYPKGVPWPMPKKIKIDPRVFYTLNPETLVITSNLQCDLLESAFERYANIMFGDEKIRMDLGLNQVAKVNVITHSRICEKIPYPDMDESYEIHFQPFVPDPKQEKENYESRRKGQIERVSANKVLDDADNNNNNQDVDNSNDGHRRDIDLSDLYEVRILSRTVWGSLRGLESFSQMISFTPNNTYQIPKFTVYDSPRFKHRGLLVDTARHFIPVSTLKNILDGMSYNKLNVFHWHIVDDQSFPFQSLTFPELSDKGAYSSAHVYRPKDVADILKYASNRGIRVIPEFDTPGHTFSWGKSHPEILTPCYGDGLKPNHPRYPYHAARENLDPLSPLTYAFVERLFREIFQIFPDPYFHAGMDETFPACWRSNPFINNLTSPRYYDPYKIAMSYYINKTLGILNNYHKKIIVWEDPIEESIQIPKNVTLQVWKNWGFQISLPHKINRYAAEGYKLIISAPWYLDEEYNKEDWKRFYSFEPESSLEVENFKNNPVVGGEACVWTEYLDAASISQAIWPRASAVAERLWSPRQFNNPDTALHRLDEQRCRMIKRGIDVRPLKPGFCGDYDSNMKRNNEFDYTDNQWVLLPS